MIFIYLDVYFFINLALDYISLFLATALFRYRTRFLRLFSASLLASVFSLVFLFLKGGELFLVPIALIVSFIAVGAWDVRVFLLFIFFEIFLGGAAEALNTFFEENLSGTQRLTVFLAVVLVAVPLLICLEKKAKKSVENECVGAVLEMGGKKFELRLLVDSGNLVVEPVTKRRVIFVGSKVSNVILKNTEIDTEWHEVDIRTASGKSTMRAFVPSGLIFDEEGYNRESFLILPSQVCRDFAGFDGIVPLIK